MSVDEVVKVKRQNIAGPKRNNPYDIFRIIKFLVFVLLIV